MKKPTTKNKKLSARGIMTISCFASMMSLPLTYAVYINEYTRRLTLNNNYKGSLGGEILIPVLIFLIGTVIAFEVDRRKYEKYKKM